ncbi:MAG: protein kinase [Nitriliruptorales bacterium]|nr:protein kinase [Nitriliruptorales bacterium]
MEAGNVTDPAEHTEAMGGAAITEHLRRKHTVVLGGRYELTERIASGGMASVWRAHDDVLARTVAVKLLHDHLAADEDFRERFRREAIAAAKLTHPHVVSLYDTGADGDRVYLVMEFVEGATLREVMANLGTLEPGQAASIGERIARALDYAHDRGLVHRDVKPANILIGDDGSVKVADFGIAKAEEHDGDLTRTGMVLGTAAYVAPEQITGSHPVDGRADQYALGCMLYEALAGRQPFKGDTAVATAAQRLESNATPLRALRPDVPRGLESIVGRAMARHPEDRFVSTAALADALAAFADRDPAHTAALPLATAHRVARRQSEVGAPPEDQGPPEQESFARSEGRWLLGVLALIIVAGALVGAALVTGALDSDRLPRVGGAEEEDPGDQGDTAEAEPITIAALASFDPAGGDGENDESLPALLDEDRSSTWRTDIYNSAEFGGLKDGVGFSVDLGESRDVSRVELDVETPGVNLELHVADQISQDLEEWDRVATADDAPAGVAIDLEESVTTRHLLIWITPPLPNSGGYKAEFSEIRVMGLPTGRDN